MEIKIKIGSELPELTCPDGEVEEFRNIPFLEAQMESDSQSGSGDGSGSGSGSGSGDDSQPGSGSGFGSGAEEARYVAYVRGFEKGLPPHSQLLCIHHLARCGGVGCEVKIFQQQNGALGAMFADGVSQNIAFWPASRRAISAALPFGECVVLIEKAGATQNGAGGVAFLIYNADAQRYVFAEQLPVAPTPVVTATPTTLTGYCSVAGQRPQLSLRIALPDSDAISEGSIQNWLAGLPGALPEAAEKKIFDEIGESVLKYIETVKRAGLYLGPAKVVAAVDGHLPSGWVIAAEEVASLRGYVDSASLHAGCLLLTVSLTALPLKLAAQVSVSESLRRWVPLFEEVKVYVSAESSRFIGGDTAKGCRPTALSRVKEGDEERPTFHFDVFSPAELKRKAREAQYYRECSVLACSAQGGSLSIQNIFDEKGKEYDFKPDYRDNMKVWPRGGAQTEDGVAIFGGEAQIPDENGNLRKISLEGSVVAPVMDADGEAKPVWREVVKVSDCRVLRVFPAARSREGRGKREPLLCFSEDGVRVLNSDLQGWYVAKKIPAEPAIYQLDSEEEDGKIAYGVATDRGIVFVSGRGLQMLGYSASYPELLCALTDGSNGNDGNIGKDGREESNRVLGLYYLQSEYGIAIEMESVSYFWDLAGKKLGFIEGFAHSAALVADCGRLYCGAGEIRIELDCGSDGRDGRDGSIGQVAASPAAFYLTRALKLGSAFEYKRIRAVACGAAGAMLRVYGADSLAGKGVEGWELLAEGESPLGSLRLPAYRLYKISASAEAPAGLEILFIGF